MEAEEINPRLINELEKRGLRLVWSPKKTDRLSPEHLRVFGAEQSLESTEERLSTGFGRSGHGEVFGNSPDHLIEEHHERFLAALEEVGIPRQSLHSHFIRTCRGKIWPTFIARLTQPEFKGLKLPQGVVS